MAPNARPLNLGEILDRTIQLYWRNFLLFAGISVMPSAVMVLIFALIGLLFASQIIAVSGPSTTPDPRLGLVFLEIFGAVLAVLPIMLAAFTLALGAANYAVAHVNQGLRVTIRDSYRYAFKNFWRHLGILFLQGLFAWLPYVVLGVVFAIGAVILTLSSRTGGGGALAVLFIVLFIVLVIAAIVASILIWLRYCLAFPASVAEGSKIWPSMQRGVLLSNGSRGRIFLMFLLIWALSMVATYALMMPMFVLFAVVGAKSATHGAPPSGGFMVILQVVNMSIGFLVRAFVMPIYVIGLMLFYYDQRTRNEGYDIEQLMARAGWSNLPQPQPAGPVYAAATAYPAAPEYAPQYAPAQQYGAPPPADFAAASSAPAEITESQPVAQEPVQLQPTAFETAPEPSPASDPPPTPAQDSGEPTPPLPPAEGAGA